MKNKLNITERTIISILYFSLIIAVGFYYNNSFDFLINNNNNFNILFVASALMLIMGAYITEPYYTKPVDVIAKTFSIFLVLIAIQEPEKFILYDWFFWINLVLLLTSVLLIFTQKVEKLAKTQIVIFKIITGIAKPKIIFSILYLLALFSYFKNTEQFIVLFGIWLLLIFKEPIEYIVKKIVILFNFSASSYGLTPIGKAIGCENPFLYKVEANQDNASKRGELVYLKTNNSIAYVGIIFNQKHLLNKRWLSIHLIINNDKPLQININTKQIIDLDNSIYSVINDIYLLDINTLKEADKLLIENNNLVKNKDNFIGYVSKNSNINKIRFHLLLDDVNSQHKNIGEGTVLETKIFNNDVLFQIIDGITEEEKLENHNLYGYSTAVSRKLGKYDQDKSELNVVKWLPSIYEPVFLLRDTTKQTDANKIIGTLPDTNYGIDIKDYDSLITHNTAILGILGIGKSCLTFELIKKIIENTEAKIICIDITEEYSSKEKGLSLYLDKELIEIGVDNINEKLTENNTSKDIKDSKHDGGNVQILKDIVFTEIKSFMDNNKKIKIINPDEIKSIQQTENAKNRQKDGNWEMYAPHADLTIAEKTRIISEEVFKILKKSGVSKQNKAKVLLIFEEAHSLVPEWNSTANSGDSNATNGTAKVILQGRKYGLGSFVITQRTANISKSILNQCNTIFALRVFDDTGKQFLENYIGKDYANTLPTLEERHAIVVGKAMKLKQPVIVKLNDVNDIIV